MRSTAVLLRVAAERGREGGREERGGERRGEERRGEERTSTKNKTFIGILNLGQKSGFGNLLSLSAMKWRQSCGRWVYTGM